jgi:DNA-binding response OmpR family regulator
MEKKILIIDDDRKLCTLLQSYLARFSLTLDYALDPESGLRRLRADPPDLVILDVMLPGMDGFEVCRRIREESQLPVIMLTARGDVTDRVVGFELGADDYLPKPFEPRELVARVQAVLRRGRPVSDERLIFADLKIDIARRTATLEGRLVPLTTLELDLLILMASNPGRVYTREQLVESLRGEDWSAFDRSVDVLVSRLRRKLGDDPRDPRFVRTVWGTGYAFLGGGAT